MFFLLSSFRFYPPLKNDGTSELRFGVILNDFLLMKGKNTNRKPSPDTGKVAASAVGRGKLEQIQNSCKKKTSV